MSNAGAPKEFQPIQDRAEAERLLRDGARHFSSTLIWTKNQENVLRTHLTLFSDTDRLLYCALPKEVDPKKFLADAGGAQEFFFSISLSYANIFFKTAFAGIDKAGLRFRIPEQVFKVQRRKDMRFRVPEGHVLKVEFDDPLNPGQVIQKKVFDISASGLAFVTEIEDESVYVSGLLLHHMKFSLNSRQITVDAEVRHRRAVESARKKELTKVGVTFKYIKAADSQFIASYAFEESRKYFVRFI